jgi:hypothetical protein
MALPGRWRDAAGFSLQSGAKVVGCSVGSLCVIPEEHVSKAVLGQPVLGQVVTVVDVRHRRDIYRT